MSRRLWILVVLGLLAALGLWGLREADRESTVRLRPPRVPAIRKARPPSSGSAETTERAYATVSCTVDGADARGALWAREAEGEVRNSDGDDGRFNLALPPGEWTLSWQHAERWTTLGTLELDEGDVAECVLRSRWTVTGQVFTLLDEPAAGVEVFGCGDTVTTDARGQFTLNPRRGECLVRARVRDGALSRMSEGAYFSIFDPVAPVRLLIDDSPVAGVGIVIAQVDDGIRVSGVRPDTPAEDAGLQEGDIIVAVDGHDAEGWSTFEAMDEITGDEGTVVKLDILRDGAERQVAVRRERLSD